MPTQKERLGWGANDPQSPHRGSVVPITVIPVLSANPLARGEKRRILPGIFLPLSKFVFRHLFTEKEPSRGEGNTQKADPVEPCVHFIPSCCDSGFSSTAEQVFPRPLSGRAGTLPAGSPVVSSSLSERVPVVPQIPLRRNRLPMKPKKSGKFPASLNPLSPGIRLKRRSWKARETGKNGNKVLGYQAGLHRRLTDVWRNNRFQSVPAPAFGDAVFSGLRRETEEGREALSGSASRIPS